MKLKSLMKILILCVAAALLANIGSRAQNTEAQNYERQTQEAKVTLKSGVCVSGFVVSFEPSSHIEIMVGGVSAKISMTDIASIENIPKQQTHTPNTQGESIELGIGHNPGLASGTNGQPTSKTGIAMAAGAPPREKTVTIAGVEVEFALIDGGTFTFGYDGTNSVLFDSEPAHEVTLSPFYVSKQYVSQTLYKAVMGDCPTEGWKVVDEDGNTLADNWMLCKSSDPHRNIGSISVRTNWKKNQSLPHVHLFATTLSKRHPDLRLSVITETQWYYIIAHRAPSGDYINIDRMSNLVMAVDMSETRDPKGNEYTIRGARTTHRDDKGLWGRLVNRNCEQLYDVFYCDENAESRKEFEYKHNMTNRHYVPGIAPFHLVMPAE